MLRKIVVNGVDQKELNNVFINPYLCTRKALYVTFIFLCYIHLKELVLPAEKLRYLDLPNTKECRLIL